MGKQKQFAMNLISQILAFLVSIGVSFIITPYITAQLGKDVYGFVGMAYQVTSYISIITVSLNGMMNIFVSTKYYQGKVKEAGELFSSVLQIDIILALVLFLPMGFIVKFMNYFLDVPAGSLTDIQFLWSLIFIIFLINLATGPFSAGTYIKNRLDWTGRWNTESNLLKGVILCISYFFFPAKVWYVGFAAAVAGLWIVINYLRTFHKLVPDLKIKFGRISWAAVQQLFLIGVWDAVWQLTTVLMSGLDLIVTNVAIGALAMGYISYAQTVPNQVYTLLMTIKNSFAPDLTKTYAEGNQEEFLNSIISAIKICGFLGSIPIVGFMVFGADFYKLWLPTLTNKEVIIINVLSIMILLPTAFEVYISPLSNVNSIMKKTKIPVLVSLGLGIGNIVFELIILYFTDLGVYSIEIATLVFMLVKVLLFTPLYAAYNLKIRAKTFYKLLLKGVFSMFILLGVFYGIRCTLVINSWMSLILVCGFAGLLGYVINYFTILDKKQRKVVIEKFNKKILHK